MQELPVRFTACVFIFVFTNRIGVGIVSRDSFVEGGVFDKVLCAVEN